MSCPNADKVWCSTFGGYTNHACRLAPCRDKARQAKALQRRREAERKWKDAPDGA